jgi:hypothetical protein
MLVELRVAVEQPEEITSECLHHNQIPLLVEMEAPVALMEPTV